MANIILFHSVLGLRTVELDLANEWRAAGHEVTLPDLFDGETSETYDGGFAILERVALDTVEALAASIAETMPDEIVIAGVSMGAGIASHVWKRKPNAKGILFLAGMGPWPDKVTSTPVQ
ncbi:MAG: dienelactone hydrolase, partial [Pseudomonadota bacterium]